MIYLHTSICIYVTIRMQKEPSAWSGNDKLHAPAFPFDDQPPAAKKKIEPLFDIRSYKLSPLVVEVRPCIKSELLVNYQATPPP